MDDLRRINILIKVIRRCSYRVRSLRGIGKERVVVDVFRDHICRVEDQEQESGDDTQRGWCGKKTRIPQPGHYLLHAIA